MKILLDTQAFIWLSSDDNQLSKKARKVFLDKKNSFFLSLASIWEMSIKSSLNKLKLRPSLERFILNELQENDIEQMPITFKHVIKVQSLFFHHRDPFDRLLAAQALVEEVPILSIDTAFDNYGIKRLW
jgi:PIN domain nuclease of toxin-antitoxin system